MNSLNFEAVKPRLYTEVFDDICENPRRFFGAANTKNGFLSFFDCIFSPQKIDTLYILGGGPGSGKSTMMKNVALLSEQKGYLTERIHCSSSPTSLDGVIIPEKRLAVIDGTSPHTYTPKMPGVREISVDPGLAWDTKALFERKDTISYLGAAKSKAYKKAYIYLRAANLLASDEFQANLCHVLLDKLEKNVELLASKELPKTDGEKDFPCEIRLQRAISCKGNIYFDSFSKIADKTYLVTDFRGIADLWFAKLYEIAHRKKAKMTVSFCPEDTQKIDGIYFHDSKTTFTRHASSFDKNINCARFADKERFSFASRHHSFVEKSKNALLRESYDALACAGKFHDLIEEQYHPCTDFSVTQELCEKLCRDIFGKA